MFSFFKKKNIVDHIEWLGIDVHSHLLPGIDDGSPDPETSVRLVKGLQDIGFSKFYCTPHIFTELYPNSRETIIPALELAKSALHQAGMNVEIYAAAEHMMDETFTIDKNMMCLENEHILVEMSYLSEYPNVEQAIFDLQLKGYHVILAHPERYNFYHNNRARYQRLKDMGVLFQMNLLSVGGYYGKDVKTTAEYLLKQKLYDLAGTDMHHEKHLNALRKHVRSGDLYNMVGDYEFKNKQLFG
ncbi:tyrosine-protein phosphatase [Pedobacter metabolipauper]|uniref:protein-tyrosine-phosphatase n=1 Tax=Pedobacter metabolipauper TaxID=425513 RepID=A0A4R6SVW3_9SPHI|nr:CpsB/CapC family capsule biosynthesis tyrosine phosphatase [Pedobacter metabolipauper]TDQ09950.1 tyrosine-protein phosphatase YwqE [Pedobacter metabolipauper]